MEPELFFWIYNTDESGTPADVTFDGDADVTFDGDADVTFGTE